MQIIDLRTNGCRSLSLTVKINIITFFWKELEHFPEMTFIWLQLELTFDLALVFDHDSWSDFLINKGITEVNFILIEECLWTDAITLQSKCESVLVA